MDNKMNVSTANAPEDGNATEIASSNDAEGNSGLQNHGAFENDNPSPMLTQDAVTEILASLNATEPVSESPAMDEGEAKIPQEEAAQVGAPDPNRMLTPEDIAKLLGNLEAQEPVVEAPAMNTGEDEIPVEEVLDAPATDPNRTLTPEDIAKLLGEQATPELVVEAPSMNTGEDEIPVEEVADAPAPDPNRMLTPEDIAKLLGEQATPELVVEGPATVESEMEASNVDEAVQNMPLEDISEPTADVYEVELPSHPGESEVSFFDSPTISGGEAPVEDTVSLDESKGAEREKGPHFIQKLLHFIKKAFSKKTKSVAGTPPAETETSEIPITPPAAAAPAELSPVSPKTEVIEPEPDTGNDADAPVQKNKQSLLSRILAIFRGLSSKEKKAKKAVAEERVSPFAEPYDESNETKAAGKHTKKFGLRTALGILGVLCLMGISFAGGFFARDVMVPLKPDPAQLQAEAEAEAKKAQDEKRAQELVQIKPKDYTSSMYLDSIILKGKAEKMTSIKLQKIDNINKLSEFHNLRKIKLKDLKGDEDLRVIQELKGIEEICIENSVLKNQFSNGDFSSVTYLEMYDSTVENPDQFANFKGLTELYVYSSKFPSSTGNLELTAFLPAIESLTLSSCGEYGELAGVNSLKKLKTLNLTGRTMVKNMTYVDNPQIESAKLDISLAEDLEPLRALANFKNIKTLTIQAKKGLFSSSQLNQLEDWIRSAHPNATIAISTY